jgi:hypothetical protein
VTAANPLDKGAIPGRKARLRPAVQSLRILAQGLRFRPGAFNQQHGVPLVTTAFRPVGTRYAIRLSSIHQSNKRKVIP